MKRAIGIATNLTVWSMLAALAGYQMGHISGYGRGVRDVARLVIELREAPAAPAPFTKGAI